MNTDLTIAQANRLAELEATIDADKAGFVRVGLALLEIRKGKLYRATHETFEDYCQERHEFGRQRASALIRAATVAEPLSEISDIPAVNESHARVLADVPPNERADVVREAAKSGNGDVTAAGIQQVIAGRVEQEAPPSPEPEPWAGYNATLDECIAELRAVFAKLKRLAEHDDERVQLFARWFVPKDYGKMVKNLIAVWQNHRILRWATQRERRGLENNRNFIYEGDPQAKERAA